MNVGDSGKLWGFTWEIDALAESTSQWTEESAI
jgi:hypothetical protein